ncbi:hypothetical protein QCA50_003462 [Cerrena zonata]|uniref:Uncharacterized protein n=1 Tax=Cerrena zonata TaxID=2478898 RepID=A0AAW0GS78_9APHY
MVETIFVIIQARTVQVLYVDNRKLYPGGPWAYFFAAQNLAINIIFYATLFSLTFLSDCLVLWRCWVIWVSAGRKLWAILAIIFPTIFLVASFVMGTLWTLQYSQPGLSFYSAHPLAHGTSFYAISLRLNGNVMYQVLKVRTIIMSDQFIQPQRHIDRRPSSRRMHEIRSTV